MLEFQLFIMFSSYDIYSHLDFEAALQFYQIPDNILLIWLKVIEATA